MKNLKNSIAACQAALDQAFAPQKYNEVYTVSRTYSEITPESCEDGDFSDHEFVYEDEPMTLKEVIIELENSNMSDTSCYPATETNHFWFSNEFVNICDRTNTKRQESLHIECSDKNWKRLIRILKHRNFI